MDCSTCSPLQSFTYLSAVTGPSLVKLTCLEHNCISSIQFGITLKPKHKVVVILLIHFTMHERAVEEEEWTAMMKRIGLAIEYDQVLSFEMSSSEKFYNLAPSFPRQVSCSSAQTMHCLHISLFILFLGYCSPSVNQSVHKPLTPVARMHLANLVFREFPATPPQQLLKLVGVPEPQ